VKERGGRERKKEVLECSVCIDVRKRERKGTIEIIREKKVHWGRKERKSER
jgi:hypothetical protein